MVFWQFNYISFQPFYYPLFELYFFLLGGFKEGVFPGVSLLSLCLLSGLPVDFAIRFGPGFNL
ncbi:hypothetical protein FGF1_40540 [Flavobacteriaceae bacterium GF1]